MLPIDGDMYALVKMENESTSEGGAWSAQATFQRTTVAKAQVVVTRDRSFFAIARLSIQRIVHQWEWPLIPRILIWSV